MVRADMLTKSRSVLTSLAAGLLLAVSSVGCDVEEPTDAEEIGQAEEVAQTEQNLANASAVSSVGDRLPMRAHQHDLARKLAVAASGKKVEAVKASNAAPFELDLHTTSDGTANFEFDGNIQQDHVGNPTTLGANKSEPEPEPWNPGEPEPEPWEPTHNTDDKDDRY